MTANGGQKGDQSGGLSLPSQARRRQRHIWALHGFAITMDRHRHLYSDAAKAVADARGRTFG